MEDTGMEEFEQALWEFRAEQRQSMERCLREQRGFE